MTTPTCSVDLLAAHPDLNNVPEDQLQWLIDQGECWTLAKGEHMFQPDEPIVSLQVLLSGRVHFYAIRQGSKLSFSEFKAPFLTGKLPFSRLEKGTGYGQALEDCEILSIHQDHFDTMIREKHELTEALVHFMLNRVRNFTAQAAQNEKLMSLGKLSAGLAHELNNPASAVVRSAQALKKHLQAAPEAFKNVMHIQMEDSQVDMVNELMFRKLKEAETAEELGLMERNEMEDSMAELLEENGIDDGYELAENLVNYSWTTDDIQVVIDQTPSQHFAPVMRWINQNIITETMVGEIEEASSRIKDLVTSVKGYTHMDQSLDIQKVDLHLSLKRTLTMMSHKFKKFNVEKDKDLAADLPHIDGFPGEINQVLTNLIDNALDAMEGRDKRVLTIRTSVLSGYVTLEIGDTGSGIPKEMKSKIFDPFFTTKEIGKGTGMGLDIVQKIITRHHGRIEVASDENGTTFKIRLPIERS